MKRRRSPASQTLLASGALCAAGRPGRKTSGSAAAATRATPLTREASAQPACISGLKPSAYRAADGRLIRCGMRRESMNTMKTITCPKLRTSRMWVLLAAVATFVPQVARADSRKPGVKEVQVPFSSHGRVDRARLRVRHPLRIHMLVMALAL